MSESVDRSHKVVFRLCLRVFTDQIKKNLVVGISKENRLDVRVVHAYVLHAVLLLISTCELMLFDDPVLIVTAICAHNYSILGLFLITIGWQTRSLRIDIIMFLIVLHKPSLILELLELLCRTLIDFRVVLISTLRKIDFRADDMIERHLIVASLPTGFFRVQDIIWSRLHLLYEFLRWTHSFERFYYSHLYFEL